MLQILINGTTSNGFLQLNNEVQLSLESLHPAFDDDFTTGEFSIPFDLPWTDNNRVLLGFPERISNFSNVNNYYTCTVFDNGVPIMQNAKLTILAKSGSLQYDKGYFSVSVSGTLGLFGASIKNKKLKEIQFDDDIIWDSMDSRAFANYFTNRLEDGRESARDYLRFAPVVIENFIDKDRKDFTTQFLVNDCINNVIIKDDNSWIFGRPKISNAKIPATTSDTEYKDYYTVPFFTVQYIVQKLFASYGYQIVGDFISDHRYYNLCLFNNKAIEQYDGISTTDFNRRITIKNHMPDILIADFLKALFGIFGIYMIFESDNKVRLVYKNTLLKNKTIANLNEFLIDEFDTNYQDAQQQRGFTLDYNWSSSEGYHSDVVKSDADFTDILGTVKAKSELESFNPAGHTFTTDDVVFVEDENMYYRIANAQTTPKKWDCIAERLSAKIIGDGSDSLQYDISPLAQYVATNATTQLKEPKHYVAAKMKGSYTVNKNTIAENPYGLHLFFASVELITFSSPFISSPGSFNKGWGMPYMTENKPSLAWDGYNGLYQNHHKEWLQLIRNKETTTFTFMAGHKLDYLLQTNTIFEILGAQFIIKQINRDIPNSGTIKIQMVAL